MDSTNTTPFRAAAEATDANVWRSCCLLVNKDLVQFVMTSAISLTCLVYCFIMSADSTGDARASYFSLITFIVGVWLPAPRPRGSA